MDAEASRLGEIQNNSWVRNAMFVPRNVFAGGRDISHIYSTAAEKYFDTSLGGNLSINPKPQFTPTADLRVPSLAAESQGMGRYYSENIDDFATRITMQFGVPEFNSLSSFSGTFFNPALATLVNRGENQGIMYSLGYATGFLFTLPLQAFFGLSYLYTRVSSFLDGTPYSKFYYMKPTMPLYWNAVQMLFNQIAVNMGVLGSSYKTKGDNKSISSEDIAALNRLLPDIMKTGNSPEGTELNGIDVYAIATRAQRLADKHYETLNRIGSQAQSDEEYVDLIRAELTRRADGAHSSSMTYPSYGDYLSTYVNGKVTEPRPVPAEGEALPTEPDYVRHNEPSLKDHLAAELKDGSSFVSFTVDSVTSVSESFSNSTKTSGLADQINGTSKQARDVKYSFADGNIGAGIGSVVDGIKNLAIGAADSVGLGGLAALGGSAYVDIPKIWEDSSAELTRNNYKMRLQATYGNKLSILLDVYLPLCMLLAGALPRSTGKASYTSPFLCRLHSTGLTDVKLGMIDSLNITRAVGGVGWSVDKLATAIDVEFSVINLDEIMHVPIMESFGDNIFGAFDEDTALSDYLGTLSGMSLYDSFYLMPRLEMAWARTAANFESWTSPAHMAQWAAGTVPGKMVSSVLRAGILR